MRISPDNLENDPELPDGLQRRLDGLYPSIRVPERVDRAVLSGARAWMMRRGKLKLLLRWAGGAAAAAALFIAIRLAWPPHANAPSPTVAPAAQANAKDINHDGQVDMLDAYLLARRVKLQQQLQSDVDYNRDGAVDGKDADVIALEAVRIAPKGMTQ